MACYSDKGRTGYNPIMLYGVITYANMRDVRAVDRIVDLCQRDLAFIWLTKGEKPQRNVFYKFKSKKLTGAVLDELNYYLVRLLDTIDGIYKKYHTFSNEHGYGSKYDLWNAQTFIIEEMEKVRHVIEENRK